MKPETKYLFWIVIYVITLLVVLIIILIKTPNSLVSKTTIECVNETCKVLSQIP